MKMRLRVPVVALALAGLFLWGLGRWAGSQGAESAVEIQLSRNAIKAGRAYRAHIDRLAGVARGAGARALAQRDSAAVNRGAAAALDTALQRAGTLRDSVDILIEERGKLLTANEQQARAFASLLVRARADSSRAALAEARAAELEVRLAALLKVAECRIELLVTSVRCPTRTEVAVGAVIGTLVADQIVRH